MNDGRRARMKVSKSFQNLTTPILQHADVDLFKSPDIPENDIIQISKHLDDMYYIIYDSTRRINSVKL